MHLYVLRGTTHNPHLGRYFIVDHTGDISADHKSGWKVTKQPCRKEKNEEYTGKIQPKE